MKTRLTIDVDLEGSTFEQSWAMARHIEAMVARLLKDEQAKKNVVVANYDTALEDL